MRAVLLLFTVAQILGGRAACIMWPTMVNYLYRLFWSDLAGVRFCTPRDGERILPPAGADRCIQQTTHKLTHNRKRAGGGNGAESTIVSDFTEPKGPQSAGKRHSEGWQSVGKDEVSSSNLDSSSTQIPCAATAQGVFVILSCLPFWLCLLKNLLIEKVLPHDAPSAFERSFCKSSWVRAGSCWSCCRSTSTCAAATGVSETGAALG